MRQVLEAGVEWGYLNQNPTRRAAVRAPRQTNSDIRPFQSWDEVQSVAAAARRYEALVQFACATGLRPQEWIPLMWGDIDIPSRTLQVNKVCLDGSIHTNQGKTDAAFRAVQLQQRALEALESLPRPLARESLVFPSPGGGLIDLDKWRSMDPRAVVGAALDTIAGGAAKRLHQRVRDAVASGNDGDSGHARYGSGLRAA
jgi:integrase